MKIGGNGPAFDFFSRHGGGAYLAPGTESKSKYTSATARAYKEELTKRTQEDAKGGPVGARVAFPGLSLGSGTSAAAGAAAAGAKGPDEEDFFDDWDKPEGAKQPTVAAAAPSAPTAVPSIGMRRPNPAVAAAVSPGLASGGSSGFSTPERSSTPTTTSSRTLNARTGATAGSRKGALGATKVSAAGGVGGSKKLGGVKKAATPINFEEAERKAREEEAKAKLLEEQALKEKESFEQAEAMAKAAIQAATASQAAHQSHTAANGSSEPRSPPRGGVNSSGPKRSSQEVERLGMGFGKLNMGAQRVAALQQKSKGAAGAAAANTFDEPDYARAKFSSQKCEYSRA